MMYSVHHFISTLIGLCNTTLLKRAATHSNILLYVGENVWSKLKHSCYKRCWTNTIKHEFETTNKTASLVVSVLAGAHHPEPPSHIQTLWDNLCTYLSIFRNCGTLRLARTVCYTVQYNTIRHSTTQLNTKQYNKMHYTICFQNSFHPRLA